MADSGQRADWEFFKRQPFGVLMVAQTILPMVLIIVLLSAPWYYEGMSFVLSSAFSLLLISIAINLVHVFRLNRRTFLVGQAALFVPCALILFAVSVIYMVLFAFGTLLSFITFIESFRYSPRLIITYAIVAALNAGLTMLCGRLAILLFRSAPNSRIWHLTTVLIDGDGVSRLEGVSTTFGGLPPQSSVGAQGAQGSLPAYRPTVSAPQPIIPQRV